MGLHDESEFATLIGLVTSAFEHLEDRMAIVLGLLLGLPHETAAGYILRAIKSPRGRYDIMRDLLELAPQNQNLGDEFDEILAEYWAIGRARNLFVHGRWHTRHEDGVVFFSEQDEHGWIFLAPRPINPNELIQVLDRIGQLTLKIVESVQAERLRQKEASLPLDRPRYVFEAHPKGDAEAPTLPPESSEASKGQD